MPHGLIVMKWNERIGVEVLGQFPEELMVDNKTLMQIYSAHEYTTERGLISMTVGPLNIASYYTGPETGIYLVLIMNIDEDSDMFEDGLVDISRLVVANLEGKAYVPLIPQFFHRLSIYPTLNEERKLAMIYTDVVKRTLLKRLQEEGSLEKAEIEVWLKDEFAGEDIDINGIIQSLIKESLIKSRSVKGIQSELIFLVNDIFITRIPPLDILKAPQEKGLPLNLVESYRLELKTFFTNYKNDELDNITILETILDSEVYEVLTFLRQVISTRPQLEKLKQKGVEDLDGALQKLWKSKMILVLQDDSGNEYFCLNSDVRILKIFPEYNLNLIRMQYSMNTRNPQVLVEYVDALKDQYNSMHESHKDKKEKKAKKANKEKKEKSKKSETKEVSAET